MMLKSIYRQIFKPQHQNYQEGSTDLFSDEASAVALSPLSVFFTRADRAAVLLGRGASAFPPSVALVSAEAATFSVANVFPWHSETTSGALTSDSFPPQGEAAVRVAVEVLSLVSFDLADDLGAADDLLAGEADFATPNLDSTG